MDHEELFPRSLAPLSWLAGPLLRARRAVLAPRGLRLGAPVISVGNLGLGGTGKTPLVRLLAEWLAEHNLHVAVLSRGYGRPRHHEGVLRISRRGKVEVLSWELAGDEPWMLAHSLPAASVYVCPDRIEAGRAALRDGAQVLLLDDGFQYLALARNLDVVCLRGDEGRERVLPAGPLREPATALAHADAAVWVRPPGIAAPRTGAGSGAMSPADPGPGARNEGLTRLRRRLTAEGVWVEAACEPSELVFPDGRSADPGSLNGAAVGLLCAIAHNSRFVDTARSLGARVEALHSRRDHHVFGDDELENLRRDLLWITTEKDAVRLNRRFPAAVLKMKLRVTDGEAALRRRMIVALAEGVP